MTEPDLECVWLLSIPLLQAFQIFDFYCNHQDISYLIFLSTFGGANIFCERIQWMWYRRHTDGKKNTVTFFFSKHNCFCFFFLSLEVHLLLQCIMHYASRQPSILSLILVKVSQFSKAVVLNLSWLRLWFKHYWKLWFIH